MAATFDVISGGRLELGIGWGSFPEEFDTYGITQESAKVRAEKLAETLDILRLLFSGEKVSYEGKYFRLRDAQALPRPVQARIPIHIGGVGERLTMPLVAKYADWWNVPAYGFQKMEAMRPLAGPRVRVSLQQAVGLVRHPDERESVQRHLERRFGFWGDNILGDAEAVADRLVEIAQRGVELFILQFQDYGSEETLRHFAREVIPRVHAKLGAR